MKDQPYQALGLVKTRVDYTTLDANHDEGDLCRNYFNKGAADLLKMARKKGADAVIDVRSVVFYEDGKSSTFQTPECSDDGQDGQILMQGIAVNWKKATSDAEATPVDADEVTGPAPAPSPVPMVTPAASPVAASVAVVGAAAATATASARAVPAKDWPFLAPSKQRYRSLILKQDEDGVAGGIRVMPSPNRVVLFTADRKILDVQPLQGQKYWLTSEFLRAQKSRSILLNEDVPSIDGQAPQIRTGIYDLRSSKLELESWMDPATGNADHILLISGPHSSWRISDAEPHDLLQIYCQPQFNELTFVRYHYAGAEKGWLKSMRAEAGSWRAGEAFPAEDRFPAAASTK